MSRRRKDPLRPFTEDERRHLTRISRATALPAVHVARATILLAVADGSDYQSEARAAGRKSGDTVSHLVTRFNREGRRWPQSPTRRWPQTDIRCDCPGPLPA